MPVRTPSPTVLARLAGLVLRAAQARGADTARLLAGLDVAVDRLDEPDARMTLADETTLWDRAALMTDDPCFGLKAATLLRPGTFDVLDYAVRTAPDLLGALQRLARYNRLVHDVAQFDVREEDTQVHVRHGFETPGQRPSPQASDFTLASLLVVASQMSGQPVHALAVHLDHAAPADTGPYRELFGVEPVFGAGRNELVLDAGTLKQALPAADPALSRIVAAHADHLLARQGDRPGGRVGPQVRRLVAERLPQGLPTLTDLAGILHISERSLQRRLEEEGLSYSRLVDQVRKELALQYVGDRHLALGEVAYLLGFSEPSAFHRAFRRWTGATPTAARRQAT